MFHTDPLAARAAGTCSDEIASLAGQLELAGADCLVRLDGDVVHACTESLQLVACEIPGIAINRLLAAAAERRAISIAVRFGDGNDRERQFEMLCLRLRELSQGGPRVGLVVAAGDVCPQAAWLARVRHLDEGPLAVLVDKHTPERHWLQLWHLRNQPLVRPVLPSRVRSPCSLLAPEFAAAVTHRLCLHVPASSAWIQMRIRLDRFADASGTLQRAPLARVLSRCVEIGDRLHDLVPWQCGSACHDAWFNRRLAIEIDGLARLAGMRAADPNSIAALDRLRDDLCYVRNTLHEQSLELAARRGVLPSIEQTDPTRKLPAGAARDDWHMRWRRAVARMSYRHRTLVAMSPWSIVSPGKKADFRYANLLPLLADTDVVAFRRSASIDHWNINKFREFHARTWAILKRKNAAPVFAERV